MKHRFVGFQGEVPRINPRLLPEAAAQIARNVRLEDGILVPLNQSVTVEALPPSDDPIKTIYQRYDGTWLSWTTIVNAANGPVTDSDRTYYTGDGAPKVIYGPGAGTVETLAVPSPATGLTISVSSGVLDPDTSEAVFYAYTYVTQWGEESQPSALSNELVCSALQIISVTGFVDPATRGIDRYRLYRSQTDTLGNTSLFFVSEIDISTFVSPKLHDPSVEAAAESLPSLDYTPPIAGLDGLCAGPNGMMAAFSGKDLYFCEPYVPHAWPAKYSLSMDFPIVGLASIGSSFVVMTEGTPYIVQGTAPANMVSTKLEQNLPCLSRRSIVDLGYSVVYASTEGLVRVTNNSAELLTGTMFTKTQWQDQRAQSIVASQHFGKYIYTHNTGGSGRTGVIIDLTGKQPFLIQHDEVFTATHFAVGTGELYILTPGGDINLWDSPDGSPKTMTWRSRLIHLASPMNFGCVLMETQDYTGAGSATMNVYADGLLVRAVTTRNAVDRLPSGFLALRWEVEFVGDRPITSLNMAHTPSELASQ